MISITIVAFIVGITGVIVSLFERLYTKRIMNSIEKMLKSAMKGNFSENYFDETLLSKLETEFAQYLNSSELSARAVMKERDKIKTMISDISHQTKTPIANLLLYSELLEESELNCEQRSYAAEIHDQSEKLRFLIDSLVKLSRMENGILTISPQKQSINDMLIEVCRNAENKASQKGLAITLKQSDSEAVFDRKWTTEAIANILDNAVKYTDIGGITVSCRKFEMFLCIDITDTGIGIGQEEQTKVFGRFYRSAGVSEYEGVGLGLHIAREIISAQKGYISISSEVGKGSSFSVFLPT